MQHRNEKKKNHNNKIITDNSFEKKKKQIKIIVRRCKKSYTDNDTKLLYCVMFLFNISAHGPNTLSNL